MSARSGLWSTIVEEQLDLASLTETFFQRLETSGAVGHFIGRVKKKGYHQTPIKNLFIETYKPMAERCLANLLEKTHRAYPSVEAMWLVHRVGLMNPGEPIVLICVAAPYRRDYAQAMTQLVEGIKNQIPCWKREETHNKKQLLPGKSPAWH